MKKIISFGILFLILVSSISSAVEEGIFFYHNDMLGSPRVITASDGNIIWKSDYEDFGNTVNEKGNNTYKFTGKEFDRDTELYYYGARYYDSELGRFITADTVEKFPNPYVYARNNPLRYVDPSGNVPVPEAPRMNLFFTEEGLEYFGAERIKDINRAIKGIKGHEALRMKLGRILAKAYAWDPSFLSQEGLDVLRRASEESMGKIPGPGKLSLAASRAREIRTASIAEDLKAVGKLGKFAKCLGWFGKGAAAVFFGTTLYSVATGKAEASELGYAAVDVVSPIPGMGEAMKEEQQKFEKLSSKEKESYIGRMGAFSAGARGAYMFEKTEKKD